jgi:hypothetical protein
MVSRPRPRALGLLGRLHKIEPQPSVAELIGVAALGADDTSDADVVEHLIPGDPHRYLASHTAFPARRAPRSPLWPRAMIERQAEGCCIHPRSLPGGRWTGRHQG